MKKLILALILCLASCLFARSAYVGEENVSLYFALRDPTDGTLHTGLTVTTFDLYYVKEGLALVGGADCTDLTSETAAHTVNGCYEIGSLGIYRVDVADLFDTAGDTIQFILVWDVAGGFSETIEMQTEAHPGGLAQAGGSTTIELSETPSEDFGDDDLNGSSITIVGGTGVGQSRVITDYVSTAGADTCTISPAWATNPDATSTYRIYRGTANTETVRLTAPLANGTFNLAADQSGVTIGTVNNSNLEDNDQTINSLTIDAATGVAFTIISRGGNGDAISLTGDGTGAGLKSKGGDTGHGVESAGGASGGDGMNLLAIIGDGLHSTGGTNGDGIDAVGVGSGVDFRADMTGDITGDITGDLSGSVGSVTGGVGGGGRYGGLGLWALVIVAGIAVHKRQKRNEMCNL